MRRIVFLIFLLVFSLPALAQFTTVTSTVPAIQGGTYVFDFVNLSTQPGPPLLGGISVFPTQLTGAVDSFGNITASVATNGQVIPLPSQWRLNISFHPCVGVTQGFNVQFTSTGGAQDITTLVASAVPPSPPACNGGGGGGAGNPAGNGVIQFANAAGNAFMSGSILLSDAFNVANNGITQAQALRCLPLNCVILRPPGSPDTEQSQPLLPVGPKVSSLVIDQTGNVDAMMSMNPQPQNNFIVPYLGPGIESTSEVVTTFSEANTAGPSLGQIQAQQINILNFPAPGYQQGEAGALYPAPPGFTSEALWAAPRGHINFYNFWGSGINSGDGNLVRCLGTGDCGGASSDLINCAGGFLVFSDEGCKGRDFHLLSVADWGGTITSVPDAYHFTSTQTASKDGMGDGRIVAQSTSPLYHQININSIIAPAVDGSLPGYVTFDGSLLIPVSNFRGHNTADCVIPTQLGTVATITNCDITVDSGTLNANNVPASSAANISNRWNMSMQVLSVAPGAPGHVIASFKANRSIAAGSFIFQGGTAGDALSLDGDINTGFGVGGLATGSLFPSIGSEPNGDGQTRVYYVNYNASQVWNSIPDPASQARTIATSGIAFGGFNLANLNRSGGLVRATLTSGLTAGQQLVLQGIKFYTVSGCADSSFNGVYSTVSYFDVTDPGLTTLIMPQAGPDASGTCPTAFLHVQTTFADILVGAEALDVENHATATTDGSFFHSFQPGFTNGASVFQPQMYSSAFIGMRDLVSTAVPSKGTIGLSMIMQGYAALDSDAIQIQFDFAGAPIRSGAGGYSTSGNGVHIVGAAQNDFAVDTPAQLGTVLAIGFVDGSCELINSSTCPLFENFNILAVEGNFVQHWDSTTKINAWCYLTCESQITNNGANNLGIFAMNSGGLIASVPLTVTNLQLEGKQTSGIFGNYVPVTQFRNPDPLQHASTNPMVAYDIVSIPPPIISATIPAGSTQYNWIYVIHTPFGDSFTFINQLFSRSSTFTGVVTMDCSQIGAGNTAELYRFVNPSFEKITSGTGICTTNSGTVSDDGTSYGPMLPTSGWSSGAPLYTGSVIAQGSNGMLAFTNPDIFGVSIPANEVTASINQPSAGFFSFNTTTRGDGLGSITAAQYFGPTVAPTGACPNNGAWVFSKDGHATFCNAGTWTVKI